MGCMKKLPVGIENFEDIRRKGFYFTDKTAFIEELIENWAQVSLFMRPRRFGKSLNMSMLKSFFETGCDRTLFEGLYISGKKDICDRYMGRFPVISVSLKDVDAADFDGAKMLMKKTVNREARKFRYLAESNELAVFDKEAYLKLVDPGMDDGTLVYSLYELTELLHIHHRSKVIVLIDEYDVPLAKAEQAGYHDDMVRLLRGVLGTVLKTNDHLEFAVLTGCLRVARESIFTGMNNFKVYPLTSVDFSEHFGFTDEEVRELLHYYQQDGHYDTVREWYDGYRFGDTDVYCPWDVINYCAEHRTDPEAPPQNYWINTSGNDVVRRFIGDLKNSTGRGSVTRTELEQLINGDSICKDIKQELTYRDMYDTEENIWSVLFMTGYLTTKGRPEGKTYELSIPNREIRSIMTEQILAMFRAQVAEDGRAVDDFCNALLGGDAMKVEELFTTYLRKTISVRDVAARNGMKENFYHGILLGILGFKAGWTVTSNRETGDGYSDILVLTDDADAGIVIEVKYSDDDGLEAAGKAAMNQIDTRRYADIFRQTGTKTVLKYGIACSRKNCSVFVKKEN